MNIFVTDENPLVSARDLDDKRVNKMILESAQMLSTAVHLLDRQNISIFKVYSPKGKVRKLAIHSEFGRMYMLTHPNHPCNIWIRQTRSNYNWLLKHMIGLCKQYTLRSGKIHVTQELVTSLFKARKIIPAGELTPFQNSAANKDFNVDFKHVEPTTEAYRLYLDARWPNDKLKPKWTNVGKPSWSIYND